MKKEIIEIYKSILLLPIMHRRYLEDTFEMPLVTLTEDILNIIDEKVALVDYGFEDDESVKKLMGTKCLAKMYGSPLNDTELKNILTEVPQSNIDEGFYATFFDDDIAQCMADILDEVNYGDDYPDRTISDVAEYIYVYYANGGDINNLLKDVMKAFKKNKRNQYL